MASDAEAGPAAEKKSIHAAEQDRSDVKAARETWFAKFAGVKLNQLIFIDEFGAKTNMTRRYARGPRGQRIVCKTPHGHWKTLSTIAAMNVNGIATACAFDGATDTAMFLAFIESFLLPELCPGHVVVMDNLPPHKSPKVDQLIESAGARVLRLPPYSPDYNPIEMAISKMKSLLRKRARRTVDELHIALGEAVRSINTNDATAFMQHCRYRDTCE